MLGLRRYHPAVMAIMAALVLSLRLVVPSGWMPVVNDGAVSIMLCTGDGPVALVMERDGSVHQQDPAAPSPTRDPCPYGLALAKALGPSDTVVLPLPPTELARIALPMLAAARLVAWRSLRPPARGPPSLA